MHKECRYSVLKFVSEKMFDAVRADIQYRLSDVMDDYINDSDKVYLKFFHMDFSSVPIRRKHQS